MYHTGCLPTFCKSIVIDAPVETVFGFHEREDALTLLSPRFPPLTITRTGGLQPGSRVELRAGPFRWVALHTAFEKDRLFVDEQTQGPFQLWVHRHEFEDLGDITRLTDRVTYRLRGGAVANAALGWLVALAMRGLFRYRHRVTKQVCERT